MMAMSNLMFGNTALILGGIVYLIVLDAVLVWLTVKVYNSDVLITGFDRNGLVAKINKTFGGSGDGDEGDN
jgi:ABC-2 type transport system permease protein